MNNIAPAFKSSPPRAGVALLVSQGVQQHAQDQPDDRPGHRDIGGSDNRLFGHLTQQDQAEAE